MTRQRAAFGQALRKKRIEKGYSLRRFAEMIDVSPTYLSQVEQGNCDPPTAARVRRIAKILDENIDEWTALAGRVPDDLPILLKKRPAELGEFLREVSQLTPDQLQILTRQARRLRNASSK